MTKVHCSVPGQQADPLFEIFDGGDFVLSSYRDIERTDVEIQIFLPDPALAGDARRRLSDALDVLGLSVPIEVSEIPDEDWKFSYRRHFRTERVSPRIFTHPPWEPMPETPNGEIVLTLDPGMAFGTGKHETTKACLQYIDELASSPSSAPRSFLDMGCGSGILSIAAAKLGFSPVRGFDIDEEAVAASRENAAANGVRADYRVFALGSGAVTLDESIEAAKGLYPDLALQSSAPKAPAVFPPAEVVAANILGPLLVAFAPEIASYAKETLIVSGILNEIYPEVLAAFAPLGFREVSRKVLGEWTTGLLSR